MNRDYANRGNNWSKENWIIIRIHRQTKYRDGQTPDQGYNHSKIWKGEPPLTTD